jgi:hypothetical protein
MKRPSKTVEIKDAMTWWLTKRRVFVVGDYEISLLAINSEDDCVKILVRNTKTNETNETEEQMLDEKTTDNPTVFINGVRQSYFGN